MARTVAPSHQSEVSRWEGLEPVGLAAMGLTCLVGMPDEGQIHLEGDVRRYVLSVRRRFETTAHNTYILPRWVGLCVADLAYERYWKMNAYCSQSWRRCKTGKGDMVLVIGELYK